MKKKTLQLSTIFLFAIAGLTANAQSWTLTGNSGTNTTTNFIGTTDNKALIFRTNNLERMRLSKEGRLGIGTTTPQAKLHVDGGSSVSLSSPGYLLLGNTSGYNMGLDIDVIQARNNGTAADLFLNYYGGRTYIGNTSLSALSDYGLLAYGNKTGVYGYAAGGQGVYGTGVYGIDAGIGQGVYGYETGAGQGVNGYSVQGIGVYAFANNNYGLYAATNNNASYYAGYFVGDVYSTTGVYAGSDQKLKQDIKDFSSAMDIINQLKPKKYQFRHDGNYILMNLPQGNHYGLIAQDVEKILPDLIKNSKFDVDKAVPYIPADPKSSPAQENKKTGEIIDFKALNYTELIPIIIKGMQEQQEVNDKQEQRIEKLEKIIEKLPGYAQSAISSQLLENSQRQTVNAEQANAYLKQNIPNPFTQNTIIYCNVPSSVKQAQLIVYNDKGSQVKSFVLINGINNVTISAGSMSSGEYVYALFIDGKKVDSKKMILTK